MSSSAPDWITAAATAAAALAAAGAVVTALLQWRATREQTRASLFSERYSAYRDLREMLQKAFLNEGNIGDAKAAQRAAEKMRFLFSANAMKIVEEAVALSWKVVEERQLSYDNRQRKAGPHYEAMSNAAKELRHKFKTLDDAVIEELGHRPAN